MQLSAVLVGIDLVVYCFPDTGCLGVNQEEEQADSESDDEEQQIYNPLKLPMGWDGKPIPYWLYKLHGLGQVRI